MEDQKHQEWNVHSLLNIYIFSFGVHNPWKEKGWLDWGTSYTRNTWGDVPLAQGSKILKGWHLFILSNSWHMCPIMYTLLTLPTYHVRWIRSCSNNNEESRTTKQEPCWARTGTLQVSLYNIRLPHHTHIIVVAHVHPTVKHNILPRNRHEDTAAPHILASPWTNRKRDQTPLATFGHFKGHAFRGLYTLYKSLCPLLMWEKDCSLPSKQAGLSADGSWLGLELRGGTERVSSSLGRVTSNYKC